MCFLEGPHLIKYKVGGGDESQIFKTAVHKLVSNFNWGMYALIFPETDTALAL